MDASDVIRRRLQSAQYSSYIQQAQRLTSACASTTCYSTLTTCNRQFTSYEQKDAIMKGMAFCGACSTVCGLN
jgi:hypothetical protein